MSAATDTLLDSLGLDDLFNDARLTFDLREGVIWNPAKTRLCILSTDLLTGVYQALVDEAGPGWSAVLYRCGDIWGERLIKRLDRECSTLLGRRAGDMALSDFLRFYRDYFTYHGWGSLRLDTSHSRESGLVDAELTDSIFTPIVKDPDQMADPMIAGILAGSIGWLAGRDLQAVQTACPTKGAPTSRFIIGAPERIKAADAMVKAGRTHEELLKVL